MFVLRRVSQEFRDDKAKGSQGTNPSFFWSLPLSCCNHRKERSSGCFFLYPRFELRTCFRAMRIPNALHLHPLSFPHSNKHAPGFCETPLPSPLSPENKSSLHRPLPARKESEGAVRRGHFGPKDGTYSNNSFVERGAGTSLFNVFSPSSSLLYLLTHLFLFICIPYRCCHCQRCVPIVRVIKRPRRQSFVALNGRSLAPTNSSFLKNAAKKLQVSNSSHH